jgi:septum formation protein
MPKLLLASGSPRRRQFLTDLGFTFDVVPSHADESVHDGESPEAYVRRVAHAKSIPATALDQGTVVLACDTVVTRDEAILGKPLGAEDFARMMALLSGANHRVLSSVVVRVVGGDSFATTVTTDVTFRTLSDAEIAWYWATGEPRDKAGGYALQGLGAAFIERIDGSHTSVIGLPLVETLALLARAGITPPWAGR